METRNEKKNPEKRRKKTQKSECAACTVHATDACQSRIVDNGDDDAGNVKVRRPATNMEKRHKRKIDFNYNEMHNNYMQIAKNSK